MLGLNLLFVFFIVLLLQQEVTSFRYPTGLLLSKNLLKSSSTVHKRLYGKNKVDGIEVDGDLTPVFNNILVQVKDVASVSKGGLYIPDNAKERPTEGKAVSTGTGRIHPETGVELDMAVKVGQNVIYGKYDGTELKYNDKNFQLIKDDDVLLVYEGNEATLENVHCVKDQILVRLPPKEDKNDAGIIITTAESKEKRPTFGTVVKVGPGRQAGNGVYMKIPVAPGDGVRFREYAGSYVKLNGAEHIVIRSYDILAKWSK